ncbi:prephenate dehydrogenase [Paenibacillus sp. FJAT-26967]|uniref:prephenate dehydrogenase n=1 Tax=Paenibacillus sp. FJAT-26967 TaxID=1729690 RepID=UPI000838BAC5|nr:prephenate dehydrogenase [Paenibacillus sp. FJAT-26967]
MTTISIFGVGLIGGSLALCFKDKPDTRVIGHSNNPISVDNMLKHRIVDEATTSMQEAAEAADIIFLCVPVGALETYLVRLKQFSLRKGCIITDVGSTKLSVVECAEKLGFEDAFFIGGHPMAGSERSGMEAASAHLFENAFYVLTPGTNTPPTEIDRLANLLAWTRAQIIRVDAREHDDIVGAISHLPHIIAVALVNQIRSYNESNELYKNLAAGGFRDITRIGSSDPSIWRDILVNNRTVLLKLLDDWDRQISTFRELLINEDGEGIQRQFETSRDFRRQLPDRRKGMLSPLYDIYADIPDHPGMIGQIATLLGKHRLNLSNLEIIESRLDVPGVLRLSFRDQETAERASALLSEQFSIHV